MRTRLFSVVALSAAVALLSYTHSFAYESGANSVAVAVQAESIDAVEDAQASVSTINTKDSERYAVLAASNKDLQVTYDKLLKKSRDKVTPDDAKKFSVCTYDNDTLQLLNESASGGIDNSSASYNRSGFDGDIRRFGVVADWIPARSNRAVYRKQQAILYQSMFTPESYRGYTGSPGSET